MGRLSELAHDIEQVAGLDGSRSPSGSCAPLPESRRDGPAAPIPPTQGLKRPYNGQQLADAIEYQTFCPQGSNGHQIFLMTEEAQTIIAALRAFSATRG